MTKKIIKKEELNDTADAWIYAMLLTTLVLLTESIKNYTFNLAGIDLTYSLYLLPFAYFIINIITKKYGFQEAVKSITISAICLVLFVVLIDFITANSLSFNGVYGEFCGYIISSFVNLIIYYFLLKNTNMPMLLVFLNFVFVLLINHFIFMLLSLDSLTLNHFWLSYFSALLIQTIISAVLTIIDKYIKRCL